MDGKTQNQVAVENLIHDSQQEGADVDAHHEHIVNVVRQIEERRVAAELGLHNAHGVINAMRDAFNQMADDATQHIRTGLGEQG